MQTKKTKNQVCDIIDQIGKHAASNKLTVYLVGGYIRDKFLRRKTQDIDIVMESDALDFAGTFSKKYGYSNPVFYGRFGTAMVQANDIKIEFATCRKESYPSHSRKPVVSPGTILVDLARRDFTINTIAMDISTGEYMDPFGGRQDIRAKLLKTPVDPDKTFYDDPLRILRGIRFASRFRFAINPLTKKAMKHNVFRLSIVSKERIAGEILKILESAKPSAGFQYLDEIGALQEILPEVSGLKERGTKHPCKELFPHTLKTLDNISLHTKNTSLKLAALLHDIGKPKTLHVKNGKVSFHRHEFVGEKMASKICKRLHVGSQETEFIGRLIRYHLWPHLLAKENPTDKGLRRFIREIGKDFKPLFTLAKADLTSENPFRVREVLESLNNLEFRARELNKKDRLSSFKLSIDGRTIMEICEIPQGKKVGVIKDMLEDRVFEDLLHNKKRELKKFLRENKDLITKKTRNV